MRVEICSARFHLRELALADVTERYLQWFRDAQAAKYIVAAADTRALSDLRQYVRERIDRSDVLFLGIFDRATGLHIGNIKYEPVNSEQGYAIMGILIGDPSYRGQGVAGEVLQASARWLRDHRHITQIVLGVDTDHAAAIRAYQAVGFVLEDTPHIPGPHPDSVTMVLHL